MTVMDWCYMNIYSPMTFPFPCISFCSSFSSIFSIILWNGLHMLIAMSVMIAPLQHIGNDTIA